MKRAAFTLAWLLAAAPAHAQLGSIGKTLGKAQDAVNKVQKLSDLNISEKDERRIGETISAQLIDRFGVYQDPAVTRYVTLVGTVLAQASSRPTLDWQFVVLDTEGVNAYAAPGGFIHITKGALGLMKNEAELAGVLGHEIAHVTEKHTIRAIQKSKGIEMGANHLGGSGLTGEGISMLAGVGYGVVFENKFDRGDEMASDKVGIQMANKVGYAPTGMTGFLRKVAERNAGRDEPNGLFASHPQVKDRIAAMEKRIGDEKLNAAGTAVARYTATIRFDAKPSGAVAMDIKGVKGAVGDSSTAKPAKEAKAEPKRSPLGLKLSGGSGSQNGQTVASAGSRGGVPDRDATGGPNKNRVRVSITPAELAVFRKGIAA
jgi:predicted Zn-dependent protease